MRNESLSAALAMETPSHPITHKKANMILFCFIIAPKVLNFPQLVHRNYLFIGKRTFLRNKIIGKRTFSLIICIFAVCENVDKVMLYRKISRMIEEHLSSNSDRMLLIDGARQIGKSYIVRWIGQRMFPNYIEINMEEDKLSDRIFADMTIRKMEKLTI